jgi:hypothetical protein
MNFISVTFITVIKLIVSNLVGLWIMAKYFIYDVAIAFENMTAGESLQRSKELSKHHRLQIFLILFLTSLITLPAYLIPFIPVLMQLNSFQQEVKQIPDFNNLPVMPDSLSGLIVFWIVAIIGTILVQIFTIPLWQSLKAVICHKLVGR